MRAFDGVGARASGAAGLLNGDVSCMICNVYHGMGGREVLVFWVVLGYGAVLVIKDGLLDAIVLLRVA